MSFQNNLLAILDDPATIHFVPGTDRADFGEIDLARNPQRTSQGFVWFMPNRETEASVTFVGKVAYDIIGDKSGAYFSLPGDEWARYMPDIVASEMAKAKVGFAVRFANKDLPEDALLPDKFFEHNQAAFEFFLSIQEAADQRMELTAANNEDDSTVKPVLSVKPFIKQEKNLRFYVVPILSSALFPQFRGARQPGVLRVRGQRGRLSLNPNSTPSSPDDDEGDPRVLFSDIPDPLGRYRGLKANNAYRRYEMVVPPVFEANGRRVHPSQYKTSIPEGTVIAIRGSMKMYNIADKATINRPYLFIFDRIQVVGDTMVSWDTGPKKRPSGSAVPGPSKRSYYDPGPSKRLPPSDDEEL
ncbi:hypothetical protein BJ322DRAFT_1113194 [Thelephora terrestris]|uniref:Uncharacterized protein n=1 Tax=Thelephora terrestris TaxID=56493 RepID=A0A9P6H755_9AGAM|nr:hypothetical protein BJ322DRAFT_1113194 [Thelephora terrestris]